MELQQTIVQPPLLVISGPSGSGKQTAINHLRSAPHCFEHVVTYTTRGPRLGETQGVEYYFTTDEEFWRLVKAGQIFEYTRTYGDSLYGSPIELAEPRNQRVQICELDPVGLIRLKLLSPSSFCRRRWRFWQRGCDSAATTRIWT
jgi:guanylate kinase